MCENGSSVLLCCTVLCRTALCCAQLDSTIVLYHRSRQDWFGLRTEIFNAGNYRRKVQKGTRAEASFFDPTNKEASIAQQYGRESQAPLP